MSQVRACSRPWCLTGYLLLNSYFDLTNQVPFAPSMSPSNFRAKRISPSPFTLTFSFDAFNNTSILFPSSSIFYIFHTSSAFIGIWKMKMWASAGLLIPSKHDQTVDRPIRSWFSSLSISLHGMHLLQSGSWAPSIAISVP